MAALSPHEPYSCTAVGRYNTSMFIFVSQMIQKFFSEKFFLTMRKSNLVFFTWLVEI